MARSWKKASGLTWEGLGYYTACGRYYVQSEYVRHSGGRIYYAVGRKEREGWASDTCMNLRSAQVQAEKYEAGITTNTAERGE